MKRIIPLLLMLAASMTGKSEPESLTMLQLNIWQEGTIVPGGYDAIVEEIARLKPDLVTLSEVRNYGDVDFTRRLCDSLASRGQQYYSFRTDDTGLLSRTPINDSTIVFPLNDDHGTVHRLTTRVGDLPVALYTAHLDYLNDAYYDVRGYDGSTWHERPIPQSVDEILKLNTASRRDEAIANFVEQASRDVADGYFVALGGDFNEPSHLDWTESTASMRDHHGFVVPWTVTSILEQAGFVDAYRKKYPDPVTYPGFTFPADNEAISVEKLTWAPKSDERDRIDYIFYSQDPRVELSDIAIFGPASSICRSERTPDRALDPFILPLATWPTDHKGLFATFTVKMM